MKCEKCGLLTEDNIADYGYKALCIHCAEKMSEQKPVLCHYCNKQIWPNMSRFEGHETAVCQQCYKDKDQICFNCRFPILNNSEKKTRICEFCKPDLTLPGFTLQNLEPISAFISKYWSLPKETPDIQWIPILQLSEIQGHKTVDGTDESLDLFIQSFFPVFFRDKTIFTYPEIVNSWFIPYFGGQLVVSEVFSRYDLENTNGHTPFDDLAFGLGRYFTYLIAKLLKNNQALRYVKQFPKNSAAPEFLKLKAMGEYRNHAEVKSYAEENLSKYAKKYYNQN